MIGEGSVTGAWVLIAVLIVSNVMLWITLLKLARIVNEIGAHGERKTR